MIIHANHLHKWWMWRFHTLHHVFLYIHWLTNITQGGHPLDQRAVYTCTKEGLQWKDEGILVKFEMLWNFFAKEKNKNKNKIGWTKHHASMLRLEHDITNSLSFIGSYKFRVKFSFHKFIQKSYEFHLWLVWMMFVHISYLKY